MDADSESSLIHDGDDYDDHGSGSDNDMYLDGLNEWENNFNDEHDYDTGDYSDDSSTDTSDNGYSIDDSDGIQQQQQQQKQQVKYKLEGNDLITFYARLDGTISFRVNVTNNGTSNSVDGLQYGSDIRDYCSLPLYTKVATASQPCVVLQNQCVKGSKNHQLNELDVVKMTIEMLLGSSNDIYSMDKLHNTNYYLSYFATNFDLPSLPSSLPLLSTLEWFCKLGSLVSFTRAFAYPSTFAYNNGTTAYASSSDSRKGDDRSGSSNKLNHSINKQYDIYNKVVEKIRVSVISLLESIDDELVTLDSEIVRLVYPSPSSSCSQRPIKYVKTLISLYCHCRLWLPLFESVAAVIETVYSATNAINNDSACSNISSNCTQYTSALLNEFYALAEYMNMLHLPTARTSSSLLPLSYGLHIDLYKPSQFTSLFHIFNLHTFNLLTSEFLHQYMERIWSDTTSVGINYCDNDSSLLFPSYMKKLVDKVLNSKFDMVVLQKFSTTFNGSTSSSICSCRSVMQSVSESMRLFEYQNGSGTCLQHIGNRRGKIKLLEEGVKSYSSSPINDTGLVDDSKLQQVLQLIHRKSEEAVLMTALADAATADNSVAGSIDANNAASDGNTFCIDASMLFSNYSLLPFNHAVALTANTTATTADGTTMSVSTTTSNTTNCTSAKVTDSSCILRNDYSEYCPFDKQMSLYVINPLCTIITNACIAVSQYTQRELKLLQQFAFLQEVFLLKQSGSVDVYEPLRLLIDDDITAESQSHLTASYQKTKLFELSESISSRLQQKKLHLNGINHISFTMNHNNSNSHSLYNNKIVTDGICIEVHYQWPLSYIFSPQILSKYNSVLQFLLKILLNKWKCEKTWKLTMRSSLLTSSSARPNGNTSDREARVISRCKVGLALSINATCSLYSHYCSLIHGLMLPEFERTLCGGSSKTLSDILLIHQAVVDCMNDSINPMRSKIIELLTCCFDAVDYLKLAMLKYESSSKSTNSTYDDNDDICGYNSVSYSSYLMKADTLFLKLRNQIKLLQIDLKIME